MKTLNKSKINLISGGLRKAADNLARADIVYEYENLAYDHLKIRM